MDDRSLPDLRMQAAPRVARFAGQADRQWRPNAPAGIERIKEPRPASPVRFCPSGPMQDSRHTNYSQAREMPDALRRLDSPQARELPDAAKQMDKRTMLQELNSVMERLQQMKDQAQHNIKKLQSQEESLDESFWKQMPSRAPAMERIATPRRDDAEKGWQSQDWAPQSPAMERIATPRHDTADICLDSQSWAFQAPAMERMPKSRHDTAGKCVDSQNWGFQSPAMERMAMPRHDTADQCLDSKEMASNVKPAGVHDDVQLSMERLHEAQPGVLPNAEKFELPQESPLASFSTHVGFLETAMQHMGMQERSLARKCSDGQEILLDSPSNMHVQEQQYVPMVKPLDTKHGMTPTFSNYLRQELPIEPYSRHEGFFEQESEQISMMRCDLVIKQGWESQDTLPNNIGLADFGMPAPAPPAAFPVVRGSQSCRAGPVEAEAEPAIASSASASASTSYGYWHGDDAADVMRRSQSCRTGWESQDTLPNNTDLADFGMPAPTPPAAFPVVRRSQSCRAGLLEADAEPAMAWSQASTSYGYWHGDNAADVMRRSQSCRTGLLEGDAELSTVRSETSALHGCVQDKKTRGTNDADFTTSSSLVSQADIDADRRVRTLRKLAQDQEAVARKQRHLSSISAERRAANERIAQTVARHHEQFAKSQEEKRRQLQIDDEIRGELLHEHEVSHMGIIKSASQKRKASLKDAEQARSEMQQALGERVQQKMAEDEVKMQRRVEHFKSISDARRADNLEKEQRSARHRRLSHDLNQVRKSMMLEAEEDRRAWIEHQRTAQQQKLAEVGAKLSDSISKAAEDREIMREMSENRLEYKQVQRDQKQVRKAQQLEERRRRLQEQNKLKQQRLERVRSQEDLVMKSLRSMQSSITF